MNDKVKILQLSYGNYVSADDYFKLQSNWNSLREWLKKDDNVYICYSSQKSNKTFEAGVRFGLIFALDKMNELEGKDKDENRSENNE